MTPPAMDFRTSYLTSSIVVYDIPTTGVGSRGGVIWCIACQIKLVWLTIYKKGDINFCVLYVH